MSSGAEITVHEQLHGYRSGHQLLSSSIRLSNKDQDTINYLSDISGALGPRQKIQPYLTGYPLPSGTFYVLAKTWQDLQVRRSGCVVTQSLLFEMEDWERMDSIGCAAELLALPEDPAVGSELKQLKLHYVPIASPNDPRNNILAETLFIHKKDPVLLFNSEQAEAISLRIIEAGWSRFRRQFSFCTFSLAPRSINGKPFKLQFAPAENQARFASWAGTKLNVQSSEVVTGAGKSLGHQVFGVDRPDLGILDRRDLFRHNQEKEEPRLNLILLWNELEEKAETSDVAILGLLDIASTLGTRDLQAIEALEPKILKVLSGMGSKPQNSSIGIDFFVRFVEKVSNRQPIDWLVSPLHDASMRLVSVDPESVSGMIQGDEPIGNWAIQAVREGAADSLAHRPNTDFLTIVKDSFLPKDVLALIGSSCAFTKKLVYVFYDAGLDLLALIKDELERLHPTEFTQIAKRLLPELWDLSHVPLLELILETEGLSCKVDDIVKLFRNERGYSEEFNDVILDSEVTHEMLAGLQLAVLRLSETDAINGFVASSVLTEQRTFFRLGDKELVSQNRATRIFSLVVKRARAEQLVPLLNDHAAQALALNFSRSMGSQTPDEIYKVLRAIENPLEQAIVVSLEHLAKVPEGETEWLVKISQETVRMAALVEGDVAVKAFSLVNQPPISEVNLDLSGIRFADGGLSPNAVERNLAFISDSAKKREAISTVDLRVLATELVDYGLDRILEGSWPHLAPLVNFDWQSPNYERIDFATQLVSASIKLTDSQVSGLLKIMFPVVHESLRKSRRSPDLISLIFFLYWDKCKAARQELVESFMKSDWPITNLLLIAIEIKEVYSILKLIGENQGANEYFQKLEESIDLLPDAARSKIRSSLRKLLSS